MRSLSLIATLIACFILAACGGGESDQAGANKPSQGTPAAEKKVVAVIPKGTTHVFWKTVHAGAEKAAKELGVDAVWVGAENESDRKQQIDLVQNFISRGAAAIVLAPLDEVALVRPVEEAVRRGIPVVIIDSALKGDAQSSFVATDNEAGGRLGADRLGEVLGGKGKVILMRYAEGSASTHNREKGFLEELKTRFPEIQVISDNQYSGTTKETALQTGQNLLNRFPDVDGIFCPNESSTFGMLRALQIAGKAGKVKFVGFDTTPELLGAMAKGDIQGLVSQDPFDMGYQGVKTAVAVTEGKTVPKRVPTRLLMVTPENMNSPETQEVISPDIEKWVK